MFYIEKTTEFDKWLRKLNDLKAKAKILFRIQKLENDQHFGDCKPVGDGIQEMRGVIVFTLKSIMEKLLFS